MVEATLIESIPVGEGFGDLAVDVLDRLEDALAEEAVGVAVAEFDGLVLASGCAAGDDGATHGAVDEKDFCFYRGIAA